MIKLHYLNKAFFDIECDKGIRMELRDHFSFYVPGYKFMPKFKAGVWDGKIYIFNGLNSSKLYIGLFSDIVEFCQQRQYRLSIEDKELENLLKSNQLDENDAKILDEIPFKYGSPRDYQMSAILEMIKRKRLTIKAPTAAGKSALCFYTIMWLLQKEEVPVLIVVPTTNLVEQLETDFIDYSKNNIKEDTLIHKIYSGKEKFNIDFKKSPIIITTFQSIAKLDKEWFEPFKAFVVDECHQAKATSLVNIGSRCVNAEYRYGLTGTLDGNESNETQIRGLFGPIYSTISTAELQEKKFLADIKIKCLVIKYKQSDVKETKETIQRRKNGLDSSGKIDDYQREIEFITQSYNRNMLIANLAIDQNNKNTLILFNFVENHGKKLYELIKEKTKNNPKKKVFFISGEVDVKTREEIRKEVEQRQHDCIICASAGTFSQGVNIVNLDTIIFGYSTKSQIKVLQSIGRGLRRSKEKESVTLFDIIDDLSFDKKSFPKNHLMKHALKRMEYYSNEQFHFNISEVTINSNSTIEQEFFT